MTDITQALSELVAAMREAAAIEIMPRFSSTGFSIREKSDADDLVTEADEQAEARMTERLRSAFPNALVVGEEAASANPAMLGELPHAELAFILDPVDGTINFASGLPLFATIGAISSYGRVVAGAILDPVQDSLMSAVAGKGAWRDRPGQQSSRMLMRAQRPASESRGTGFWLDIDVDRRAEILSRVARQPSYSAVRCSGHEYRLLASGGCDFLLCATPLLKPWDHAAGLLLCREAGGFAATLEGDEWSGLTPATSLLCASTRSHWQELRDFLCGNASDSAA